MPPALLTGSEGEEYQNKCSRKSEHSRSVEESFGESEEDI